jgi:hypothetical protein
MPSKGLKETLQGLIGPEVTDWLLQGGDAPEVAKKGLDEVVTRLMGILRKTSELSAPMFRCYLFLKVKQFEGKGLGCATHEAICKAVNDIEVKYWDISKESSEEFWFAISGQVIPYCNRERFLED